MLIKESLVLKREKTEHQVMSVKGLGSQEALKKLHSELIATVAKCKSERSHLKWMKEAWLPSSVRSLFRVTSLIFSVVLALALIATRNSYPELVSACVILLLTCLNLVLSGWESFQRSVEMFKRAEHMMSLVKDAAKDPKWSSSNYPHLHNPLSASIVLQWTVRDGDIVNLPWSLLVTGRMGNDNFKIQTNKGHE